MRPPRAFSILVAAALVSASACQAGAGIAPTPTVDRATPYADSPAAGICGEASGDEVVMTLEPGIPDPRCILVTAGQHLRVVNRTGGPVDVALGPFAAHLEPEEDTVFGEAFADYLLPGVHALVVTPCCGGELWLKR